jgi:SSS family solute:Na+ symporter
MTQFSAFRITRTGEFLSPLLLSLSHRVQVIINSASNIISLDIWQIHLKPLAIEGEMVKTRRISWSVIIPIAALVASFFKGINQVFQFIQEYSGLISHGIIAIFVLGIFWKNTTAKAA